MLNYITKGLTQLGQRITQFGTTSTNVEAKPINNEASHKSDIQNLGHDWKIVDIDMRKSWH